MTGKISFGLDDVQAVYGGAEGDLWELIMGEQIHIGGFQSSMDLAEKAGIAAGTSGIDLCCCNGAGMRFLAQFKNVARMLGVDATEKVVARGKARCQAAGLADRIRFKLADVCSNGLPGSGVDFVWGEDAWCYVVDKPRLISEAARLVRPGGTIAFTDWVEGPKGLRSEEEQRLLKFMKFPNVQCIEGYAELLKANGCEVLRAENTGRFAPCVALYMDMVNRQLTYDVLRTLGFNMDLAAAVGGEMTFMHKLAQEGKIAQGLFVARKKE